MMEQRGEIIKRLNVTRKQSLLLEQEVDGRLIRFRIRKPSTSDFEDAIPVAVGPFVGSPLAEHLPMVEIGGQQQQQSPLGGSSQLAEQATLEQQAASSGQQAAQRPALQLINNLRPDEANVRRMHTALTLNEAILKRSKSAKLVIINLPGAPKASTPEAENNCK